MKKWYKESYFNANNWILENYDVLGLNSDEVLMLLLIVLGKTNNINISYEFFKKKMGYTTKKIDEIIASLVAKKFLQIKPSSKGIEFDIDGIFDFDPNQYEIIENKDIYQIAEELLCRPLSSSELQRLSDLITKYGDTKVTDALRVAEAYRKNNLAYVEAILKNEKM